MIGKHLWPFMRRGPIGASLMILLTGAVMYWIFSDCLYFFRIGEPMDLGDVESLDPRRLENDTYVRLKGLAVPGNVISYDQGVMLSTLYKHRHSFFPLVGRGSVFVEITRPENDTARALPGAYAGRLRQAKRVGLAYRKVFQYMNDNRNASVADDSWILFDGESPGNKWWAVLLEILFVLFILNNLRLLYLQILLRRMR